jgi:SSS family solute:Na+ symporter/sodium/proline symporter
MAAADARGGPEMIYITVIAAVVLVLIAVTIHKTLSIRSKADFMVAGRKLPWGVLVFTLLSSWIGAGSLFGGAENAYKNGFAALWQPAGGWFGLILIYFIAARARRFAQYTVPDLLETRYNAVARLMGTVAIVVSCTVITSYQFIGGGDILHLTFPEVPRTTGMYIIAGFVILFTAAAGMASVAYLDLVIGCLVTVTVVVAVPLLLNQVGGWSQVQAALPAEHFTVMGRLSVREALSYTLPTMLLLIGNQGMYQKFFSARSERDARLAVAGWIAGALLLETLLVALAVIGSSRFRLENAREILPTTARLGLPPLVGAVLLGGMFAKVISTANNYLFSPATNIIHDVYTRFLDPHASEKRTLAVSRIVVAVLGVLALIQGAYFKSILAAALYAYTIYGAAVTPAVMAVFFWKRATTAGAIASITLGTVTTVVWQYHKGEEAIYPALAVSVASLVLVSLLTDPPAPEKVRPFFEDRNATS